MTVDATKLRYFSGWDIDQLVATGTLAVGVGATPVYAIPATVPLPEFEVQLQPTGSSFWYRPGANSSAGATVNINFYTYILGTSIFINTDTPGTARYFVWADKFNY